MSGAPMQSLGNGGMTPRVPFECAVKKDLTVPCYLDYIDQENKSADYVYLYPLQCVTRSNKAA
jgi:hypothetical protein